MDPVSAHETRMPTVLVPAPAAVSATGTYDESSARHAPAVTPAQQPESTPGRRQSRPGGRSAGGTNTGMRRSMSAGPQLARAMAAATASDRLSEISPRAPDRLGPATRPIPEKRLTRA